VRNETKKFAARTALISLFRRADEAARTVYVANVNGNLTLENVKEFFSVCGPVSLTKLAGEADGTRLTRFAFVEFVSIESVPKVRASPVAAPQRAFVYSLPFPPGAGARWEDTGRLPAQDPAGTGLCHLHVFLSLLQAALPFMPNA
jgi:hypothetical protein